MPTKREMRMSLKTLWEDEDGAIGILLTVMLPVVAGFTSLAVDMAYVWTMQDQLQITADAAALAGTMWVGNNTGSGSTPCTGSSASPEAQSSGTVSMACNAAELVAQANAPSALNTASAPVLNHADIVLGVWSGTAGCSTAPCGSFTALASAGTGAIANSVQVTTRLTAANGNAIGLFFTPLLNAIRSGAGFSTFSLTATATAAFTSINVNPNATGTNPPISDLIVVQDVSSSFSSEITSGDPATAEKDCAKAFQLTSNANSKFGVILFTGNSPQQKIATRSGSNGSYAVPNNTTGGYQGGWCPGEWNSLTVGNCSPQSRTNPSGTTITANQATQPYTYNSSDTEGGVAQTDSALNQVTGTNFLTNMDTSINNIGDCSGSFGTSNPQYSCSGTNLSAGLQAAINQFCPASGGSTAQGCLGGNLQVVIITDGASNCSTSGLGTSVITGQGGKNSSGTYCPSGSGMTGGDGLLLQNDYNNATAMGNLGITLSTIFYTGGSGSGGNGPDGLSYSAELQKMVTLNNTAMSTYAENEGLTTVLQGQYFNQPTGSAIPADMMAICASGGGKPRLVL